MRLESLIRGRRTGKGRNTMEKNRAAQIMEQGHV
jgi:hypothetical protein